VYGRLAGLTPWWLVLGVGLVTPLAQAAAASSEVRDFTILVDGKQAGTSRMTIQQREDGLIVMTARVDVRVRRVIVTYNYTYSGTEVWKDGRLQQFTSTCNDNGKRYAVTARAQANGLRVNVNGRDHFARPDTWLTSYWQLPDRKYHNQAIPILDADTGKDIPGRLNYMAAEQVTVAGQQVQGYHFRVSGGPATVDVWYDTQGRLIRQSFVEDGHQTVIQAAGIKRETASR
jgi:hypothetical protein